MAAGVPVDSRSNATTPKDPVVETVDLLKFPASDATAELATSRLNRGEVANPIATREFTGSNVTNAVPEAAPNCIAVVESEPGRNARAPLAVTSGVITLVAKVNVPGALRVTLVAHCSRLPSPYSTPLVQVPDIVVLLIVRLDAGNAAHVASPRQKVEEEALVPELNLARARFPPRSAADPLVATVANETPLVFVHVVAGNVPRQSPVWTPAFGIAAAGSNVAFVSTSVVGVPRFSSVMFAVPSKDVPSIVLAVCSAVAVAALPVVD